MNDKRPIVGITMGDPVGVGPEIICSALDHSEVYQTARPLVIGDIGILEKAGRLTRTAPNLAAIDSPDAAVYEPGTINVLNISALDANKHQWGAPNQESSKAALDYILRGADLAKTGGISALTTCPINKAALKLAGSQYPGHTEMLAQRTGTETYAMMLAGKRLRVVLVTIHVPLKSVPEKITPEAIDNAIWLTDHALKTRFGIFEPRIAVAALNPHAGEEEMFGAEEDQLITPAISRAVEAGIRASGPHPADTVFYKAILKHYDAVVCMYHDQGLIPFKMIHFTDGVNITLGLPIIRTSVDHGTAYDIAGKGVADPGSLMAAIEMAAEHAMRVKKTY